MVLVLFKFDSLEFERFTWVLEIWKKVENLRPKCAFPPDFTLLLP